MTRIRATSLDDLKFQQNDTPPTRAQKLELIRLAIIALTDDGEGGIPAHTHEISEIIGLQDALDALGLTLLYRFGAFWIAPPTDSETMMLHTLDADITLYADFAGSVGDIGGLPAAPMEFTVYRNPTFTLEEITGGQIIGTFTVSTAGAFTFATTSGNSYALLTGDRVGVKAPATVEATAAGGSFTFSALYGTVEDYLALLGDQTDGDDVLLLSGDQQDGIDRLIMAGE